MTDYEIDRAAPGDVVLVRLDAASLETLGQNEASELEEVGAILAGRGVTMLIISASMRVEVLDEAAMGSIGWRRVARPGSLAMPKA